MFGNICTYPCVLAGEYKYVWYSLELFDDYDVIFNLL